VGQDKLICTLFNPVMALNLLLGTLDLLVANISDEFKLWMDKSRDGSNKMDRFLALVDQELELKWFQLEIRNWSGSK